MASDPNKLSQFWQELKRRKVLPILIGYLTACVAIIELSGNASDTFSLSKETVKLLWLLSAIGIPVVFILPWVINRKKTIAETVETSSKKASSEEAAAKHNLPAQLTTFIGREKEMQTVKDLISVHRLITLTGAGGCGKTRLAIEVAAQLVMEFEDGIWFVNLAPIISEDRVVREIAEALTITEVSEKSLMETIIEAIKEQKLLIILDNCEHLIKTCTEIADQLIQSSSNLKILCTSRQSLGITGEQVWRIPSLSLLDPKTIIDLESVKESEAVLLFNDRARLKNPEFELEDENVLEVVTICNKVEGIPLAVELVASRTSHMDPKIILERFADRIEKVTSSDPRASKRQQTLHATIEWSYNLLSDSEKLLFERLSVFSGGFDIVAAEEVCSNDCLPKDIILDTLSKLVDRSLVYTMKAADQSMRYNCLETLRQFGLQVIKQRSEEEALKKRHLQYYLAMADEAYQEQYEEQLRWLNKIDTEEDNLMTALEWSKENLPEEFSLLSGSLSWYWRTNSKIVLARGYLEWALSIETNRPEVRARALNGLGYFMWYFSREEGIGLLEESLDIWTSLNNLQEEAYCLAGVCELYTVNKSEFEIGLNYGEKALELARKIGKQGFINHCLKAVCQLLVHSKLFEQGLPYVEELIIHSEKLSQPFGIMAGRHFHSDCALGVKDFQEAEKRYGLGIQTAMKYGNDFIAMADLQGVAFAVSGQSRWAKSLRLNAAANAKAKSIGVNLYGVVEFWDEWIDTYIEGAKKEVGQELAGQYEEEGIEMGFEKAAEYALDSKKD
jgi:non-specific serine/threonine protein kinase